MSLDVNNFRIPSGDTLKALAGRMLDTPDQSGHMSPHIIYRFFYIGICPPTVFPFP